MTYSSFTLNGRTHLAVELLPGAEAVARWSVFFAGGGVLTACRKSLKLEEGELATPGYEVTCGNCKRSKAWKAL